MKLHPYPTESMSKYTTIEKVLTVLKFSKSIFGITLLTIVITVLVSVAWARIHGKKAEIKKFFIRGIAVSVLVMTCKLLISHSGRNEIYSLGILASLCILYLLISGAFKKSPVLLYIGIYPVVYTIAAVTVIASSASTTRFGAAVPALIAVFLVLIENESRQIRVVALTSILIVTLLVGYTDYTYMRRDGKLANLKYKVESGVYKGMYTTETRANDLPELENYLNQMVSEDEYYAFRDNVPCGYLMLHKGTMCDVTTWDKLQYSYERNTPSALFEYYRKRDAIPDKIIYVDFGRDDNLSIEDENFRYNDFVHAYYECIDDLILNETFSHVIVYQYIGGFDGDYDYWIETYMNIP